MNLHPLTTEEIEQVAKGFKDDLSREGKRCVRRKDMDRALAAFAAEEYIDQFVATLRMRAGSELGRPKEPRQPKKRIPVRHAYALSIIPRPPAPPVAPEEAAKQRHIQEVVAATRYMGSPRRY